MYQKTHLYYQLGKWTNWGTNRHQTPPINLNSLNISFYFGLIVSYRYIIYAFSYIKLDKWIPNIINMLNRNKLYPQYPNDTFQWIVEAGTSIKSLEICVRVVACTYTLSVWNQEICVVRHNPSNICMKSISWQVIQSAQHSTQWITERSSWNWKEICICSGQVGSNRITERNRWAAGWAKVKTSNFFISSNLNYNSHSHFHFHWIDHLLSFWS